MAQPGQALLRRIRCIKSSLDNAEQSFLDNKEIRGELDLMLAEAEMQNLRRKKDVPWSWNRQLLAGCAAVLLVLAGFGGWYCAKDHYLQPQETTTVYIPTSKSKAATPIPTVPVAQEATQTAQHNVSKNPVGEVIPNKQQVTISNADLHKLVRSARVELSNSK